MVNIIVNPERVAQWVKVFNSNQEATGSSPTGRSAGTQPRYEAHGELRGEILITK